MALCIVAAVLMGHSDIRDALILQFVDLLN